MTSQTKRNHSETFNAKEFYDLCDKVDKEEDSTEVFTNLNSGKIPLTNAELIKGVFLLNVKNNEKHPEIIEAKQQEIALEWDRIEARLQNAVPHGTAHLHRFRRASTLVADVFGSRRAKSR